MKRAWATLSAVRDEDTGQLFTNPREGDDRAQEVALALAAVSDAEFLRSVLNAKAALDQFGGQYVIAAKRVKIDEHSRIDPEGKERLTIAYAHAYQHVADAIREEREPDSKPHQIDFHENGHGEELEQPPEDEPEPMEAAPEAEEEPVA